VVTLVVPGSSERMLAKARTIDADELVIDLEDAVIPERKGEALQLVLAALAGEPFTAPRVTIRVNAVGSPWAHQELIALAGAPGALHGVIVPKVQDAGDLAFAERLLSGAEAAAWGDAEHARQPLKLQALIETARGLSSLATIVTASDRLDGVILGYADLAVSLGRSPAGRDDLDRWLAVQDAVLIAARTAGIRAIDGPHLSIDDVDGLTAAADRSAALGFDGKWAIHPSQLQPIRAAFAPTAQEITHARNVLDALRRAATEQGGGAVALDGEMLDEPVRLAAVRTLERAGTPPSPSAPGSAGATVPA
jgi:citrate lyase subunit beta/citryl-CoA lyase